MHDELIKAVQDLINSDKGENGRLRYILETLKKGKPLFSSDQKYLENFLGKSNTKDQPLENNKPAIASGSQPSITDKDRIIPHKTPDPIINQNKINPKQNKTKSKIYATLILSGIVAIFALVNLYNNLIPEYESEDRFSDIPQNTDVTNPETEQSSKTELPSDPKVAKLVSMMVLLMEWQFILESAEEFGDTSSGFLRIYPPNETITDLYGEEPTTIVATAVNMLSILGPHNQDVIDAWEYDVMRNLSRMNSKQIVGLIDLMDEEAKQTNLEGDTLIFFNEQKEKALEILDKAREKEPSEETKQLVLTSLQKYADDAKRHKENLSRLELIETHYLIQDKMSEYINHLETAIDEFTLYVKTGEPQYVEESANQAEAASRLQYEIDEIIKVESNT